MKLTPSPTARRRTATASVRFLGGPQMPSPVRRIAPNPRRCTEISPPSETLPPKLADISFAFMIFSFYSLSLPMLWDAIRHTQHRRPKLPLCCERAKIGHDVVNLTGV